MSTVVQDCILHLNTSLLNFYTVVIFVVRLSIFKEEKNMMDYGLIYDTSSHLWSSPPPYRCTLCMFCILHLIQKHLDCPRHI